METEIKFSSDQQIFVNSANAGENIFLTGKAGTGKSFVAKYVMDELFRKNIHFIAVAPTGIAANNIGGQTMHSMFGLPIDGVATFDSCSFLKAKRKKVLKKAKVIIIDEVSMLRPDLLDAMNWTLIKNGLEDLSTKQIIFIGDLKQLPPVVDDNMKSMLMKKYDDVIFKAAKIYKNINVRDIDLGEVLRQSDPEFIQNLNVIRDGGKSEYFKRFLKPVDPDSVILAPHSSTVTQYNQKGLAKIKSREYVFKAKIDGKVNPYDFNLEKTLVLKDGCKIMYLVNSKGNPLFNGTIGTYRRVGEKDFIEVKGEKWLLEPRVFAKKEYVFNEDTNELELEEIGSISQLPVKLAYALTIHKSQGLTFEKVTIDLKKRCFAKGQLYVALSRVTSPDGLTIVC